MESKGFDSICTWTWAQFHSDFTVCVCVWQIVEYEDSENETEYFKEYTEYHEYDEYDFRPAERQEQFFSGQVPICPLHSSLNLVNENYDEKY